MATRLELDARWHRAEADRLTAELAAMAPAHRAAIGQAAVDRMGRDRDIHAQLAAELEAYVDADRRAQAAASAEE